MDFFDKLSKKATEAFEITKEKTSQLSKEVQLRNKVYRNNNKIEELYEEIGELIYTATKKGMKYPDDKISAKVKEIDKIVAENKKAEKEILELRKAKICVECGKAISIDDEYCAKCGAKQPKVEKKAAAKPAAKKAPAKKTTAKKTVAKKVTKAPAKKATKPAAKKTAAKKPVAKKAPAKKTTTKKVAKKK